MENAMRSYVRFITALAALLYAAPALADRYEFDKSHTSIVFHVNHLGFSEVMGVFTKFNGDFEFDRDHPEKSKIDVKLSPSGIRTSSELLDDVLQGKDFFNTATYPGITFVSRSIKVTGKNTGDVTGDVTLLGVTRPVTLHVTLNKADYAPITNMYVAGFHANATLKRSDFGMTYSIPLVGDDVRIDIDTEGVNLDRKKEESLRH
jgi:polyisoprenoid-binding protein YceI